MAPFDADALLDAVDAGLTPSETRVVVVPRSYFLGEVFHSLLALALLALVVGGVVLVGVVLFTPLGGQNNIMTLGGDGPLLVFLTLSLLVVLVVAVVVMTRLVKAIRGCGTRTDSTPRCWCSPPTTSWYVRGPRRAPSSQSLTPPWWISLCRSSAHAMTRPPTSALCIDAPSQPLQGPQTRETRGRPGSR